MTTLVKNIQLLRGDGSPVERKDVLISGQKISAIGNFSDKIAINVYDGQNSYLSPGWIDFHSEIDHQAMLQNNIHHSEILNQGVTTVIGGQDGVSLAPTTLASLKYFRNYGGEGHGVNWRTFGEFMAYQEKNRLAINFGSLVGYSTLRAIACGGHHAQCASSRMSNLVALLRDSLSAGALGLSMDINMAHNTDAFLKEVEKISPILAERKKILVLDLSQGSFRNRAELMSWLAKINCRVVLDNFMALHGKEESFVEEVSKLENVYLEYPSGSQDIPIFKFFPEWFLQNPDFGWKSLADPWVKSRVLKDMPVLSGKDLRVARTRHSPAILGLTISEYAKHCDFKNTKEALVFLARSTYGQTTLSKAYRKTYPHWLGLPRVLFSGQSARANVESREHPGAWPGERSISDFLATLINGKVLGLPEAVRKMTTLPAELIGLPSREGIKEGDPADLTIFEVQPGARHKDKISVRSVFVNGALAWDRQLGIVDSSRGLVVRSSHN